MRYAVLSQDSVNATEARQTADKRTVRNTDRVTLRMRMSFKVISRRRTLKMQGKLPASIVSDQSMGGQQRSDCVSKRSCLNTPIDRDSLTADTVCVNPSGVCCLTSHVGLPTFRFLDVQLNDCCVGIWTVSGKYGNKHNLWEPSVKGCVRR
jgi:hypothetical protein